MGYNQVNMITCHFMGIFYEHLTTNLIWDFGFVLIFGFVQDWDRIPSGYVNSLLLKMAHWNSWFTYKRWWFSMAMLVYQRVSEFINMLTEVLKHRILRVSRSNFQTARHTGVIKCGYGKPDSSSKPRFFYGKSSFQPFLLGFYCLFLWAMASSSLWHLNYRRVVFQRVFRDEHGLNINMVHWNSWFTYEKRVISHSYVNLYQRVIIFLKTCQQGARVELS